MATIFSKIIAREIPTDIVYEDELCLAFKDINPQAPVHVLVIPKKEIARLVDAVPEDQALLGHLMLAAGKIARQLGVGDAFRVVVNNGAEVGQSVFHVHLHILAGRGFRWPPGWAGNINRLQFVTDSSVPDYRAAPSGAHAAGTETRRAMTRAWGY